MAGPARPADIIGMPTGQQAPPGVGRATRLPRYEFRPTIMARPMTVG
ncbi:hypothetical protein [Mycobacterium lepromatosis]